MPVIKITVTEAQLEIVDDFAKAMGMRRAYAARFFMLRDALDWYASMMRGRKLTDKMATAMLSEMTKQTVQTSEGVGIRASAPEAVFKAMLEAE